MDSSQPCLPSETPKSPQNLTIKKAQKYFALHKLNLKDEINRRTAHNSVNRVGEKKKWVDNGKSVFGMRKGKKSWEEMLTSIGIFRHPQSEKSSIKEIRISKKGLFALLLWLGMKFFWTRNCEDIETDDEVEMPAQSWYLRS